MSEYGRRSTMQSDPYARSHLPVPSTIKKPAHSGRMSMAGPALRGPYPNVGPVPGSNPRHSMMRSQALNPLLQSASKPHYGRTPLHPSTRRGSTWVGAPPGSAQVAGQGIARDTRNLRDRQTRLKMQHEVESWLQETGLDSPALSDITKNSFRAVFRHLVLIVDPECVFDEEPRKLEEEFVQTLRSLKYLYVGQFESGKWSLATPGAMNVWPLALGVLHWLTESGKVSRSCTHFEYKQLTVAGMQAKQYYLDSRDPTLQDSDFIPDEFDDINHHQALALDHYTRAYEVFLEGKDLFPEQEAIMEDRYARKDERVVAQLEQQREELKKLLLELEALERAPAPIEELKKDNGYIKQDKAKFEEILRRCESSKKKLTDTLGREKTELASCLSNLERLQAEESRLADIVREQNLLPEEATRMKTEHETLTRDIETLKQKIAETNQVVVKLEVSLTRKVSEAEEALDAYTNLLNNLGLFPPLPPPLEQDLDLSLDLNPAASNSQGLLMGADIRRVVKPTLSRITEMKRTDRADVESERIKVDHEFEQLTLECENLDEEVLNVGNKVTGLSDQADELRDAAQQEAQVSNNEAARLERDLAQARTAAMANGVGVKSRLQALQIAYREQIDKVNRLKDETMRAIIKNSSEIIAFKEEVSKQLEHLRDFADAN
ncbi:hypothetical protein WOLCODRAFT_88019 [Wolfiporia cocos MD-104 SS10]|uniref:Kinetochore protein NDC80 n=1 Tax=Wolfiporia cocos (strain MD-104) TaxID=742152 RepID=A0A2H3J7T4_WOLCO|nr:hypothetical protein WOLCODRAFT_88019 [Wolfiporia cocos MD-104 SS10]